MSKRTKIAPLAALLCGVLHAVLGPGEVSGQFVRSDRTTSAHEPIRFAVVSDRTGRFREGVFERAMAILADLQPDFVVSVGDLIEGYSTQPGVLDQQWSEVERIIDSSGLRFYAVPGNHDIGSAEMRAVWAKRHGRSFFHVRERDVLILGLDSNDTDMEAQARYFRRVIREHADVRWVFVFLHHPQWEDAADSGARRSILGEVEALLGDVPYTVLAGHIHRYRSTTRAEKDYIVLGPTGGGSQLRGPSFGEVDHITWISMADEGPRISNIEIGGVHPSDFMTAVRWARLDTLLHRAAQIAPLEVAYRPSGTEAHGEILLTNDLTTPIRIEGRLIPPRGWSAEPTAIDAGLRAGAVERIPVALRRSRSASEELPVLRFEYTLRYVDVRGEPDSVPATAAARIGRPDPLVACTTPVTIDGKIEEWDSATFLRAASAPFVEGKDEWLGPADASLQLFACFAGDTLKVAISTRDDELISARGLDPFWERDGMRLQLDLDPVEHGWEKARGRATNGFPFVELLVSAGAELPLKRRQLRGHGQLIRGWTGEARANENGGTDAEFAVPLPPGLEFVRLNALMIDIDSQDPFPTQVFFRPRWTPSTGFGSRDDYAGAGVYRLAR